MNSCLIKENAYLAYLEEQAHIHAFTPLGTFYWELFLIKEIHYNAKYTHYQRRW